MNEKILRAVHINEARKMLDLSRMDNEAVDVECWKSDGTILVYKGWKVKGSNWKKGFHRLVNPRNGEVRAVPDIFIIKVNGHQMFL